MDETTIKLLEDLEKYGCVYHRDNLNACDRGNARSVWLVEGDVWCGTAAGEDLQKSGSVNLDMERLV